MIDWQGLVPNALWITGLSIALTVLSYTIWQARVSGESLRQHLSQAPNQVALNLAGLLFCLGLAGSSSRTWEQVVWLVLGLGFALQIGAASVNYFRARS